MKSYAGLVIKVGRLKITIRLNFKIKEEWMEEKKRKGYKTTEQQMAATKRYLENNPEAKIKNNIANYKSKAKKFIKEMATDIELEELMELIKEKLKKFLKNSYHSTTMIK